jgi:hypothetical protein
MSIALAFAAAVALGVAAAQVLCMYYEHQYYKKVWHG